MTCFAYLQETDETFQFPEVSVIVYFSSTTFIPRPTQKNDVRFKMMLVDKNLSMTQQCVLTGQKTNCTLGCIKSSMASRSREGILPLCSAETLPGVLHPALEPPVQERPGPAGVGLEKGHKNDPRVGTPLLKEGRAKRVGLFSLEKRRLRGDLIAAFQYLKGAYMKDGDKLCSRACCERTRGNGFQLDEGRFRLDIRKKFFTLRVVKHWNGLPRDVVDTPFLETFKIRLDGALSNLI